MNNSHPEGRKKSARELQIEADNDNCAEFPVERPPPPPPVQETEPKVGELDVTEQDEPDGAKPVSHMTAETWKGSVEQQRLSDPRSLQALTIRRMTPTARRRRPNL